MKARTAVVLCIAGAVLTFAVSGHPAAVDLRLAGVILMLTGAAGLWPRGGNEWLRLAGARLRQFVDEAAPARGDRVPLEELLSTRSTLRLGGVVLARGTTPVAPADGADVWTAQAGHQEPMRVLPGPQEVTRDGEASERTQAG
jgi:hypothetical protein